MVLCIRPSPIGIHCSIHTLGTLLECAGGGGGEGGNAATCIDT